jgi:hypothetical protein
LPGADGGGVSPRPAADNDHVVNCVCHSKLPKITALAGETLPPAG